MAEQQKEEPRGAVAPFRPGRSLQDLRQEMSRLWDHFGSPTFARPWTLFEEAPWPAVDVFEREGNVVVKADIPGMSAKDVEIHVSDAGVTISGERSEEKEVKEKDYHRSERSYGRFLRQVPLPSGADRSKAEASFKDGVLEITFPIQEAAKAQKIEIKST